MLNSWTHEWSWLDFRKQHFKLTEQEARTKFLLEQQKYEADMHTLYMQSINGPAGGGAIVEDNDNVTLTFTIDLQMIGDARGRIAGNGTGMDFMYLATQGVLSNSYDTITARKIAENYYNENPDKNFITVNWGDGIIEKVPLSGWADFNDLSPDTGNGAGYDYWRDITPQTDEVSPFLKEGNSWRFIWNNSTFDYISGMAWYHRFHEGQKEYIITVTGPEAYVNLINPWGGDTTRRTHFNDTTSDFFFNFPAYAGWTAPDNRYYPAPGVFGGIKSITYNPNRILTPATMFPALRDTWAVAGSIHEGTNGWIDVSDPDFTPPQNIIDNINNCFDTNGNVRVLNFQLFGSAVNMGDIGIDITNWDVSNVLYMASAFQGAGEIPGNITNWDVGNCKSFSSMFRMIPGGVFSERSPTSPPPGGYVGLNQDLSGWDMSSALSISEMFRENTPTNNSSPSFWNLPNLETARRMYYLSTGISDANLEIILKGWADNPNTANNVNATEIASSRTYSIGSDMDLAIQTLTAKGWTISGITIS